MVDAAYRWRRNFLSVGAKFLWFCLPFKQVSVIDHLSSSESWITWEPGKEDVWMRKPPDFDVVLDPADNQLHALSTEVVVERGEQHPDDFGAVGEVDVSDLALAAAHRSGVDVVALRHVAVGCCGELSVDVNELHDENLRFTLDKSSIKK